MKPPGNCRQSSGRLTEIRRREGTQAEPVGKNQASSSRGAKLKRASGSTTWGDKQAAEAEATDGQRARQIREDVVKKGAGVDEQERPDSEDHRQGKGHGSDRRGSDGIARRPGSIPGENQEQRKRRGGQRVSAPQRRLTRGWPGASVGARGARGPRRATRGTKPGRATPRLSPNPRPRCPRPQMRRHAGPLPAFARSATI